MDVESDSDALKSNRNIFRYPERSLQVKIAFYRHINALGRNSHCSSNHLASDLRAGGKRTQQQVSRTGSGTCSTNALVRLRVVDGPPQVDRAGDGRIRLAAARGQRDSRTRWILPIPVFQRLLQRSNIHKSSPEIWAIINSIEEKLPRSSPGQRVRLHSQSRRGS